MHHFTLKQYCGLFLATRRFKSISSFLLVVLLSSLFLNVCEASAQTNEDYPSPTPNAQTQLNSTGVIAGLLQQWSFETTQVLGYNPRSRSGDFALLSQQAQINAVRENPKDVLWRAQEQANSYAAQANSQTPMATSKAATTSARANVKLEPAFAAAAQEFDIPADFLKAASYPLANWEQNPGQPSIDDGYGVMHLVQNKTRDDLTEAAQLIKVNPELLKTDTALNIRAGAALLRKRAQELGGDLATANTANKLGYVLERWSGFNPAVAEIYIQEVFTLLRTGFKAETASGETIMIAAQGNELVTPVTRTRQLIHPDSVPPVDYPGAIAFPSSKYTGGRGGQTVKYIVIGFGAGTLTSLLNTYTSLSNPKSVHYVVGRNSAAYQLVSEGDTANFLNPANPGYSNQNFIGISLEGSYNDYIPGAYPNDDMYNRLRDMVQNIAGRNGLAVNCTNVVGQGVAAPGWGTNPRPRLDWSRIIPGTNADCTVNPPPPPPVVLPVRTHLGTAPYAKLAGEPVNPLNGNMVYYATDMSLPANGSPFTIRRVYNSLDERNGPLGLGWTFNHDMRLEVLENGAKVEFILPDGRGDKYERQSDGSYKNPAGFYGRLVQNGDGSFTLTQTDQTVLIFSSDGRLLSSTDRNGNRTSYGYTDNKLTIITDSAGRTYTLNYNAAGKIERISDPSGRSVVYGYGANNTLTSVTDLKGATYTYSYEYSYNNLPRLTAVKDGRGNTFITNQYDSKGRVSLQTDAEGKKFRFEYETDANSTPTKTRFYDQLNRLTLYEYDAGGRPVKVTNALGGLTTNEYDANGNLVVYRSPAGRVWRYEYDANGNRMRESDPNNRVTTMEYNASNDLVKLVDPNGGQSLFSYDAKGNQTSVTLPDGTILKSIFDAKGRLISLSDPRGGQNRFEYDQSGNLLKLTNALNQITTYEYDGLGRLTATINPLGYRTAYTYDNANNRTAITDPLGQSIKFEYDAENNQTALIDRNGARFEMSYNFNNQQVALKNPLGHTVKSQYNAALYLEKQISPRGGETRYVYDALNRVIGVYDAVGRLTAYEYDADGDLIKVVAPDGAVSRYEYDSAGQLTCSTDALNIKRCLEYDVLGRVVKSTDGRGNVTTYQYDALGRLLKLNQPIGSITYQYDASGNLVRETDALNRFSLTEYDALNRPVKFTDKSGSVSTIEYDAAGQVIKRTNWRGFTTSYSYDAAGRLLQTRDPLGNSLKMEYDVENRPVKMTDQRGKASIMSYDAVGRLIKVTDPTGGVTQFAYNESSQLIKQISPAGRVTELNYNLAGELISEKDGLNRVSRLEYDAAGRIAKLIDPANRVTEILHDALGRQIAIKDTKGGLTSFTYDADGNPVSIKDALGQVTTTAYDALNRRTKLVDPLGSVYEFGYNVAGELTTAKKPRGGLVKLSYDAMSRPVIVEDALGYKTTISYDAAGNLVESKNARGFTEKRSYDPLDRLTQLTARDGSLTKIEYDAVGLPVKTTDALGRVSRTDYDDLQRPVRFTDANNGVSTITYDPDGLPVATTDALGRVSRVEYDAAGQPVATTTPKGATTRLEYDPAGNVVKLIDPLGFTSRFEYDALNEVTAQIDPLGRRTELTRDALSRLTATKNPRGFTTLYGYDALSRLTSVTDAKGGIAKYTYDTESNLTSYTNPKGGVESFAYDLQDQTIGYKNALGNSWSYAYDALGNRTETKDANGRTIRATYDALDRLARVDYPKVDGKEIFQTREYDAVGNLVKLVDEDNTSLFSYDALNRTVSELRDNALVRGSYDAVGNLTRLTMPNGTYQSFAYNADNQLEKVTDIRGGVYEYKRDIVGRDTELRYPNGAKTFKAFDAAGQLTLLSNLLPGDKLVAGYKFGFDANGNRTSVSQTFDRTGLEVADPEDDTDGPGPRIPAVSKLLPSEGPLSLFNNKRAELNSTFTYDELDRLSSEKHEFANKPKEGYNIAYEFDANSNITKRQVANNHKKGKPFNYTETFDYDAANHLLNIKRNGQDYALMSYDPNGNRVTKQVSRYLSRYEYDAENRLIGVDTSRVRPLSGSDSAEEPEIANSSDKANNQRPYVGRVEYIYDGLGRLQYSLVDRDKSGGRSKGDAYNVPIYWGNQLIAEEWNGKHKEQPDTYYTIGEAGTILGSLQPGRRDRKVAPSEISEVAPDSRRASNAHYYQHDWLGSLTLGSNARGKVVGAQFFGSYGEQQDTFGLDNLPNIGFNGQRYDDRTGLTQFYARWYDPATTRWMNEDPYRGSVGDPVQHNRSLYVRSNPVNLVDPLGFFDVSSGRVQSGDSLWNIAQQVYGDGSRWNDIYNANRDVISNPNLIYPGQYLRVPNASQTPDCRSAGNNGSNGRINGGNGGNGNICHTYTVRSGDTLSGIAASYGVSYWDIARLSGIANPDMIYAGQTVNIPCGSYSGGGYRGPYNGSYPSYANDIVTKPSKEKADFFYGRKAEIEARLLDLNSQEYYAFEEIKHLEEERRQIQENFLERLAQIDYYISQASFFDVLFLYQQRLAISQKMESALSEANSMIQGYRIGLEVRLGAINLERAILGNELNYINFQLSNVSNVLYMSQMDYNGRYAGAGSYICSATSLAMTLRYFVGNSVTLESVADGLMDSGYIDSRGLLSGNYLQSYVQNHQNLYPEVSAQYSYEGFDPNWIVQQLQRDALVIATVPGHVTLISGYRLNRDGTYDFYMSDPYRGYWSGGGNSVLNNEWVNQQNLGALWEGNTTVVSR